MYLAHAGEAHLMFLNKVLLGAAPDPFNPGSV